MTDLSSILKEDYVDLFKKPDEDNPKTYTHEELRRKVKEWQHQ